MIFYKNGNQTPNLRKYDRSRKETSACLDIYGQWSLLVAGYLSMEEGGDA